MKNIVCTGIGAITPIGIDAKSSFSNLLNGQIGLSEIDSFDTENLDVKLAGIIKDKSIIDATIDKKLRRRMSFMTEFALVAVNEAIKDRNADFEKDRTAIIVGTALGALVHRGQDHKHANCILPKLLPNMTATQIAIAHKITGPSYTLSTACASGEDAIGLGKMLLEANKVDTCIIVGAESCNDKMLIESLDSISALVKGYDKNKIAPFSDKACGFLLSEGASAIILEKEETAKANKSKIYGRILGYFSNQDGYHITTPNVKTQAICIENAIKDASLSKSDIGYINAHGTGSLVADFAEANAMIEVFGKNIPPTSSTKASLAHMMAAGSVFDTITCFLALKQNILPATLNTVSQNSECKINLITQNAMKTNAKYAMNNAFGFGGQNASIIVSVD